MSMYRLVIAALALFILFTAAARLHDALLKGKRGKFWMTRKIGMACVLTSMAMVIGSNFFTYSPFWMQITIFAALLGWALTWFTTPNERPWWDLVFRNDPNQ